MDSLRNHMSTHHGVASRGEARSLGVSDSSLRRMIGRGEIIRVHPRVYRAAAHGRTWRSNARSAALSSGGVVSHRAAAAVWGIDGFPFALTELTIGYPRSSRLPGVTLHRSKQFSLIDETILGGIPVTGISRTVLDVAAVVGPQRLENTIDAVIRQKLLTWPDLYSVLVRHSARGRDGCGKLRKVLDVRYGDSAIPDSSWNRNVGVLLLDCGLPEPAYELEVVDAAGLFIARVDLAYPRQRVAIELDSVRWHLNRSSFEADPRRKNRLLLAGWKVLTFTWSDYVDNPRDLVSTVRSALL
ncbi:MAG: hypothetical protein ACI81L_001130 [Verrucomicrobiales bacterium]|jgi:hypothetical protein